MSQHIWGIPVAELDLIPEGQVWLVEACRRPSDSSEPEQALLCGHCGALHRVLGILNLGETPG